MNKKQISEKQRLIPPTDKQIKDALGHCSGLKPLQGGHKCENCPFHGSDSDYYMCVDNVMIAALALIERLEEGTQSTQELELEEQERKCYCTNEVPETDCEGCNFVLTCSNNYGLSEK